jgi:acetolactate synthase I/II/III large subunit
LPSHQPAATYASFQSIETAAALINKARHPLILVGNGAIRGQASTALTEFATALNLPVANSFMGKGVIPYTSPLALWSVGLQQRDFITCGFEHADLVIVVGYDAIEYSPKKWNPQGDLPIVHIGALPAEIDSSYIPQVEVIGDISDALGEILKRCDRSQSPAPYGLSLKPEIQADYEHYANDEGFPIRPQKLVYDLRQVLGDEDILISDVGAHKMWIARHYHCTKPNTCLISNGFAAMGIAIPGALAAKLVHPDRQVIAATGDGGFMMNMQELETALRLGLSFVTLIFNDGGYGLIEWKQMQRFGSSAFIKFTNPDFVKLAESMGLKGYRVTSADRLIPTIQAALAQPVPTVIDCPVDYRENLLFSRRSGALTCDIEN